MNRREPRAASKNSGKNAGTARETLTPVTPTALYDTGLHHARSGRHLDAQLCCQQALQLDPDHADTLHLMGQLFLHAGQYDHAVEWISRAIRQDPRVEYLSSLGITLQKQGRLEEALKVFEKAIQLGPDNAEVWRRMGDLLVQQERHDQALVSFEHALKLNPNHAPTLRGRAQTLFKLKRMEESLAEGKQAYLIDPDDADTCNNIAAALLSLGRDEEALEWLDKALALHRSM
jgi:tetratricopeptide (TPR) repeat protein